MSVFIDICESIRLFFRTHANIEINISTPTIDPNENGHIRFYLKRNLEPVLKMLAENLDAIDHYHQFLDYASIWLKTDLWTDSVIKQILTQGSRYGSNNLCQNTEILVVADECDDSVTSLRISLLKNAFQNLAVWNGYIIGNNGLKFLLSKKNNSNLTNLVICGNVVPNITSKEYKQQKHDDISKMCASRTDNSSDYPIDIISKLCHSSIVYELLCTRHNKVIRVQHATSNKDKGIFIMYNYSRLCQVLAVYEKNYTDNYYRALPDIEDINFKVLQKTEEWILIFNYLSVFPSIIQECTKYLSSAHIGVYKLCSFLVEMSSCVSSFYHKHNILMDPLPHFLPLMYARLYLVKALIQVYENAFHILGIEAAREI
ncbi:DALR anticodon-binding domain-containing protein 3 [Sipha flava]|uniref:DALR anticodon-binding domain-containing protein 3 n=1 Tax=Sipha flava TaxID=143950 RepID=A0A8B8F365_9HEMI|nr:DALR anticodon-binding domain-containing protein 3 [Sipha flava]